MTARSTPACNSSSAIVVSKQMDGDPLPLQRRAYSGGVRRMFFQQMLHAMNAQALTLCIWKQQAFITSLRLT